MAGPIVKGYKDLEVWQKSVKLARYAYRLAAMLPESEEENLRSQIRRAATSVCNNIVEGNASATRATYANYVGMSRASVNEVRSDLELCVSLGFLAHADIATASRLADEISAMLWVLRAKLLRIPPRPEEGPEPQGNHNSSAPDP